MSETKIIEFLKEGEQFFAGKNYDRAVECFHSVLQLNPDSAEAFNNLGVVYTEKGDLHSAADNFAHAVRLKPNDRDTILNCADIHSAMKRFDLAADVCGLYLKSNPNDDEIRILYHLNSIKGFSSYRDRQSITYDLQGLTNNNFTVKRHSIDPPSISVIVVTGNDNDKIDNTLDSISNQNYDKLECVVVSRESSNRVSESVKRHSKVVMNSLPGVSKVQAINSAISLASGDILCWLEPGDELEPAILSDIADYFHRYPARSILAGDTQILMNNGETLQRMEGREITADKLASKETSGQIPPFRSIFIRKQLFDDFGNFDEKYESAFDYDFYLRVSPCHCIFSFGCTTVKTRYKKSDHDRAEFQRRGQEILSLVKHNDTVNLVRSKVSVIIPCYNYAEYLPYTVGSVLAQTFRDIEIIIVNDGSTDDTQAVAEKLIADNPRVRIKVISQNNSGQPAISRNRAISNATGDYILPLDGDDEIDPNLLAEAVGILDDNPQIALVYPDQTHVWPDETKVFKSKEWDVEKFRETNLLPHCALFRRHLWGDVGGYRTNVIGYEDWDFWIGCAEKGYLGQRLPKPYFIYRRHERGVFASTGNRDKRLRAQAAVNHPILFGEKMVEEAQEYLKSIRQEAVPQTVEFQPEKPPAINKTMDFDDLSSDAALAVIDDLNRIILDLKSRKLKISSWYGHFDLDVNPDRSEQINRGYNYKPLPNAVDDINFPWFLYWELVWIILNADFKPGQKVLDLGGSSSLFSYYLASKGLEVTTVDLQQDLVDNGNRAAAAMGWNLRNYAMDMRKLAFSELFDHIVSVCVYEHIPMYDRVEINARLKEQLKPGGRFSITFDYRNPSKFTRFNTPEDVYEQFIKPSGLNIRGNEDFEDSGKSYLLHPFYYNSDFQQFKEEQVRLGHFDPSELGKVKHENDYTFAALFLENS